MTVILDSRADMTVANYRAVVRGEQVAFSEPAVARMAEARRRFERLITHRADAVFYGITTDFGSRAGTVLDAEQRLVHARRLPQCIGAFGARLPDEIVRGIVFARLANFVEGHSAISPHLAVAVADMLGAPELPQAAAGGHGGAGEILCLAQIFWRLADRHERFEKDANALINGSPCAAALVTDACLRSASRLQLCYNTFALAAEAFRAPTEAYDPALGDLWGDDAERAALERIHALVHHGSGGRRPYQAPVSFRALPRVLGLAERAAAQARRAADASLRAVTDNPVFVGPSDAHPLGRLISNAGFHNTMAWPAIDGLAGAWAELCLIGDRLTDKMHDGALSHLPPRLVGGSVRMSTASLGMLQVGYGEEARHHAQRTFTPATEGGGEGQDDLAPPTFLAWRREREAARCLDASLAILAAASSQAIFLHGCRLTPALERFLDLVRASLPPIEERRDYSGELSRLAERFHDLAGSGDDIGL